MFDMKPIDPAKKRGWKVLVDGHEIVPGIIEISSQFGTLTYGQRPEGYDAWVFRQMNAGGVVTIPYSFTPDGKLLVGFLYENRANMGGVVACVIGGFIDPGEKHDDAQARKTAEEAGIASMRATLLPGMNSNANRAFFVCDANAGEGDHMYGLFIPYNELESVDGDESFCLRQDAVALLPAFKKGSEMCFLPWREAVRQSPDGIFQAGVARLLAEVL
ncbi:MAG: NUDIX domain-containing protein [bacterium]|nr:NUDIX domain-containing protein [bacterium]